MILFFAGNRDLLKYFSLLAAHCHKPAKVHWCRSFCFPSIKAVRLMPQQILEEQVGYAIKTYEYLNKKPASTVFRLRLLVKAYYFFCRDYAAFEKEKPQLLVVWNGMMFRRSLTVAAARQLGIPVCFMENGLLPNTTVCDMSGVNAGNSIPRDEAFFQQYKNIIDVDSIDLVARKPVAKKQASGKKLPEQFIFVPFQVDTDSQILVYSPWINNMDELFRLIIDTQKSFPHLRFVFKEHPSSRIDYAYLHQQLDDNVGIFANEYPTQELIEKSTAVLTINSTVGLEAILLNKPVIVLGRAFYTLPGIAWAVKNTEELKTIFNAMNNLVFDSDIKRAFISYLYNDYLMPGSWKIADNDHVTYVVKRIENFVNQLHESH